MKTSRLWSHLSQFRVAVMLQSLVKQLNRFAQPRAATSTQRPDAEIVALPQPDGTMHYRWQGGSVASVKAQFLEMQGISVSNEYFSIGPYNLKIVRYDDHRECYVCELISTDIKAANFAWSSRTAD